MFPRGKVLSDTHAHTHTLTHITCDDFLSPLQAKTEAEVLSEQEGLHQDRVWVVHKGGFCLGTVVQDTPKNPNALSTHVRFFKVQVRETNWQWEVSRGQQAPDSCSCAVGEML